MTGRKRSVAIHYRPSSIASEFIRETCGSVSGYESGYFSTSTEQWSMKNDTGEEEEDNDDDVFGSLTLKGSNKKHTSRQMKVIPAQTNNHHRKLQPYHSLNTTHLNGAHKFEFSPDEPKDQKELLSTSVPRTRSRSKSPIPPHLKSPDSELKKKKLKAQTLDPRLIQINNGMKRTSSANSVCVIGFETRHNISSPIHQPLDLVPSTPPHHRHGNTSGLSRLRGRVIKRKSLKDLRDIDGYYDVS